MSSPDTLHVVAAAIVRDREVLVAQRPDDVHCGGLWEFPGGKVEPGEGAREALVRELREEIGIVATDLRPLIRVPHDYGDRKVLLDVWKVEQWQGEPQGAEGQPIAWKPIKQLDRAEFPAANAAIVTAVQLPSAYVITPEPTEATYWGLRTLHECLKNGIKLVQLRAKEIPEKRYRPLIVQYAALCKSYGAKLLINADIDRVVDVGIEGVHLTAAQLSSVHDRPLNHYYLVGASCHDSSELARAVELGADFAVLSPVKSTDSHPRAEPLGWDRFREMVEPCPIPVFALGGLGVDDMNDAWSAGAQGVAGISQLWSHYGVRRGRW